MKKKLNVKRLIIVSVVLICIIILIGMGISDLISESKEKKTIEYKLSKVGYTTNEIKVIKNNLSDEEMNKLLNVTYDTVISKLISDDFFIYDKLTRYVNYYSENDDKSVRDVVAIVNSNQDKEWYEDVTLTDTSKGSVVLVNRYYGLTNTYVPEDLVTISSRYAYGTNQISESAYDSLISLIEAGQEEGFTLLVEYAYRSYDEQKKAYTSIEESEGTTYADDVAARPGHSDYQTGLSLSMNIYEKGNYTEDEIKEWLQNNSYKYGFIIRYPEGKEDITGFTADPWRVRYVGKDAASVINSKDITFDEYYEYYINNGGK